MLRNLRARVKGRIVSPKANEVILTQYRGSVFFTSPANKVEKKLIDGNYDEAHFDFMEKIIHDGDICLDVGANIGVYSVVLSKLVGQSGQVHAFEPVDHIRGKATRNLRANSARNTTINACAIGSEAGELEMFQVNPDQFRGGTSSLVETENMSKLGADAFTKRKVQVRTIDEYVAEKQLPHVDFIKMDIEGFEYQALLGAKDTLLKFGPIIIFEHSQPRLKKIDRSEDDHREYFDEVSCDVFEIVRSGDRLSFLPYAFDREMTGRDLLAMKR